MENKFWDSFNGEIWKDEINVRDFIVRNYAPYEGDAAFLSTATQKTNKLWDKVAELFKKEREKNGVLDIDVDTVQTLTAFDAGYIDKDLELVVGLQTDAPLKRAVMPWGGIKVAEKACTEFGYELNPKIRRIFKRYAKTHNQGVFDAYTTEIKKCRHSHLITGLPDAYGRGRIIGDYRRVALYGVDRLIEEKRAELLSLETDAIFGEVIRSREETADQVRALQHLKEMALKYGYDISMPASDAFEAVQWTYFGYLAAIKDQDGAAMSFGRVSTFLDIYFERDIKNGKLTEQDAQELIDQLIIKLRMVRFLRANAYNQLFSGDPTWTTEALAGMCIDGRTMVTKTTYRFLQTLYNLGAAPEPNLTVLYSKNLPQSFKEFCAQASIDTGALQYENDDLMRVEYGDDYAIACCVSAMRVGKQMQFFGARCNLAKALLYALNQGKDEISGEQIAVKLPAVEGEYLDYDDVFEKFSDMLTWITRVYMNALNIIHYMHDKYCYESLQMALHDKDVIRTMATGIAGFSVVVDSLSAIKYAKVKPIKNENGLIIDFEISGDFPKFGNNDERVDKIALDVQKLFMNKIKQQKTYRKSIPTTSILTITSNVVYGEHTGCTPDGRKTGEAFAPGANPMHGRDTNGALASLESVAKLNYSQSLDGISNTFTIVPTALGKENERSKNLTNILDGYFSNGAHHLNVNVLDRELLENAMEHPEKYPQLTIRVSGYAVNFVKLPKTHQLEVIARTFHNSISTCDEAVC